MQGLANQKSTTKTMRLRPANASDDPYEIEVHSD
jgi:hypothetical protein